jgi:hypothetical protein
MPQPSRLASTSRAHGSGPWPEVLRSPLAQSLGEPAELCRFADVWDTLCETTYDVLPEQRVGLAQLPRLLGGLYGAARRTLHDPRALRPHFDKLVHPLGVCLRGAFRITRPTPYDGYFAEGSEALVIARASDAVGEDRPGRLRFLGMAGKLFPTTDPHHTEPLPTADFFALENLAGSHTRYFAHASFTNDILLAVPHLGALAKGPLAAVAGVAFAAAERTFDTSRAAIRQLYPIAELGGQPGARAPRFLRLTPEMANPYIDNADLRLELVEAIAARPIRYHIELADGSRFTPKAFRRVGELELSDAVISDAGDHRLHFRHPPYRR